MMMNGTQMIAKSAAILETPTRIGPRCAPFSLERLDMWYNNNTNSGKDREANDGDTDSMLSAESIDLIVTSKLSPLQHHCQAILNSNKDANGPAVGVFDADGNWACLTSGPKDSMEDQDQGQEMLVRSTATTATALIMKPVLNRHHRTHIVMTRSISRASAQQRASGTPLSDKSKLVDPLLLEDDENSYNMVGFTSYQSGQVSTPRQVSEGQSMDVLLHLCLEEDLLSDESKSSIVTGSQAAVTLKHAN